jgi:hypothetical protein
VQCCKGDAANLRGVQQLSPGLLGVRILLWHANGDTARLFSRGWIAADLDAALGVSAQRPPNTPN